MLKTLFKHNLPTQKEAESLLRHLNKVKKNSTDLTKRMVDAEAALDELLNDEPTNGSTTLKPSSIAGNYSGITGLGVLTELYINAGLIEYYNNRFYITNVETPRAIDRTSDVITSTTTVSNTVTETTLWTGTLDADDLKAGNILKIFASGIISNATASDDIEINVYLGTTKIGSFKPAIGNVTNEDWHIYETITVRSVGASGSLATHGLININGNEEYANTISSVDTTISQNLTINVIWDNAKVANSISIYQGHLEFKN